MNSASALADHQGLEEELNRICKLPDELLSKILSCLSFNEAVRSSVLSIRWINLWKSVDLELNFDCNSVGTTVLYVNWANGVVKQLQQHNSKIRKFRAVFTAGHAHCLTMAISTDGWSLQFRRESSLSSYPSCFSTTSSRKIVTVTSRLRLDCQISDPSDVYVWVV